MYIITCRRDGEELKLLKDDDIKYNWGKNIFEAVTFETKKEAIEFIKNEPMFTKVKISKKIKPFLLSDIDINSVYLTYIEEIKYKKVVNVRFDKILGKLK